MPNLFKTERVAPDSSRVLKDRLQRLRYAIYCDEMKLPIASSDGRLADTFDEYSTSILLSSDGVDVGTIRWTATGSGPLEIEQQSTEWANVIRQESGHHYANTYEINRFMVRREFRASGAAFKLINTMRKDALSAGCFIGFFAGKDGPLTRYYLRFGSSIVDHRLRPYILDGIELGKYSLMKVDFGQNKSMRQFMMSCNYSALSAIHGRIHPLYKTLMNRGSGFRPQAS